MKFKFASIRRGSGVIAIVAMVRRGSPNYIIVLYEPKSKLLVSPLISPIVVSYMIPYIPPLRSLDYSLPGVYS